MLQLYFLGVLLDVLIGVTLIYGKNYLAQAQDSIIIDTTEEFQDDNGGTLLDNKLLRLVMGVLAIIVGALKLLFPVGGSIIILGDLLIVIGNILGGLCLVYEFYRTRTSMDGDTEGILITLVTRLKKYIGVACIVTGILHFAIPWLVII